MNARRPPNILVMGIGNYVQSDDGFGVHAIRELEHGGHVFGDHVTLLDAGTSIVDQLSDLTQADRLICIDVAAGGQPPGTVYRFAPGDVTYRHSPYHNAHKISIFDVLAMVEAMTSRALPTTIVAVQPQEMDWGTDLSPTVLEQMPTVLDIVHTLIGEYESSAHA